MQLTVTQPFGYNLQNASGAVPANTVYNSLVETEVTECDQFDEERSDTYLILLTRSVMNTCVYRPTVSFDCYLYQAR
jgi:hypothetical protein